MAPIITDNCEFECATSVDSSINNNNSFENDNGIDIANFTSNEQSNVSDLSQVQADDDHVEAENGEQKQQQMPWEAPGKQGLYDPQNEHEACGVGFIVAIDGKRSHKVILTSLIPVTQLET